MAHPLSSARSADSRRAASRRTLEVGLQCLIWVSAMQAVVQPASAQSWWGAPVDLGGVELTSSPASVSRDPSRIDVFYRGPNNHLWTSWWDGGQWWSAATDLGGIDLTSAPAAVSRDPQRMDVFYRGPNNHLWTSWWDGSLGWSACFGCWELN